MGHSRSASVEQDADRECNDPGRLAGTFRNRGGDLSESLAAIYRTTWRGFIGTGGGSGPESVSYTPCPLWQVVVRF